ncbi:MAG TPA: flagellar basal body-associated FliL family protein [Pirellulales bacterium]|jgi:flagellar basal body-associated protein FliL|nr:flagellar basal body-associated FliL family protein [Pirellulales bacterium]
MAHEAKTAAPSAPAATAPVAEQKGSSKFKLIGGGLIALITLAECAVGLMYLPSASASSSGEMDPAEEDASIASESHASADSHGAKKKDSHGAKKADAHGSKKADPHGAAKADAGHKKSSKNRPPEQSEVDLGSFRVTAFQPLSNTTVRVDFYLYGTVGHGQEEAFASLFEAKKQRFRDQVIATIRSADMADFTEAGLGLLKRRILETTNRTIGKPSLEAVLFSEFSFIEQ